MAAGVQARKFRIDRPPATVSDIFSMDEGSRSVLPLSQIEIDNQTGLRKSDADHPTPEIREFINE